MRRVQLASARGSELVSSTVGHCTPCHSSFAMSNERAEVLHASLRRRSAIFLPLRSISTMLTLEKKRFLLHLRLPGILQTRIDERTYFFWSLALSYCDRKIFRTSESRMPDPCLMATSCTRILIEACAAFSFSYGSAENQPRKDPFYSLINNISTRDVFSRPGATRSMQMHGLAQSDALRFSFDGSGKALTACLRHRPHCY